ncbi:hypothetical protein CAV_1531 [Campylobacter avium LMG 24591]|uniref:Bacteriocin-type signal sequence domain protein n=1 Tax=Campylobacter avium LMG 24591 TaxID=522484 RepID=A0A222MZ65_9BACT|nr:hypothetical protein [Campylobacter avium]ASQ31139.1 hypothetical protein CAV_1531 [Campylobacter avium LMG 24591]OYD78524.1 hypothetical protein CAV8706_1529 [Campylobacter avium]
MFKKLFVAFGALVCISTLSFATDLLAELTNGKLSDNSPGVKVLSLDEKKQVKGGYVVQAVSFQNYSNSYLSVKEYAVVALFGAGELDGGICALGKTSCYIDNATKTHSIVSKDRFKEFSREAKWQQNETLSFSVTRTISFANPFAIPQISYKTSAYVVGINSLGQVYKLRNANAYSSMIRDMKGAYEKDLKNLMGF